MSDRGPVEIVVNLRPIDQMRLERLHERTTSPLARDDIWFIHTVLAQCFLPYRDPKTHDWTRKNGDYSIVLMAGHVEDPKASGGMRIAGLPYGAKPRLFQSYVCTQTIKHQSPVIPVERSMTAMMQELGLGVSGGKEGRSYWIPGASAPVLSEKRISFLRLLNNKGFKEESMTKVELYAIGTSTTLESNKSQEGTIRAFKEQITRFAACHFTIVGPGPRGTRRHIKAPPIKKFDVWFPLDPDQETLWPSEITLTDEYYYSLKDHAIPFDFRALKAIQNKPRSQDIYLWMTQRLARIPSNKPLLMRWNDLYETFGGQSTLKKFKQNFPHDLVAARVAYPDAKIEEHKDGYLFRASLPPIPQTKMLVQKPVKS